MGQYHRPAEDIPEIGRRLMPYPFGESLPRYDYLQSQLHTGEVLVGYLKMRGVSDKTGEPYYYAAPLIDSATELREFATTFNVRVMDYSYYAVDKDKFGKPVVKEKPQVDMFEPFPEGNDKTMAFIETPKGETIQMVRSAPNPKDEEQWEAEQQNMIIALQTEYERYKLMHHVQEPPVYAFHIVTTPEHENAILNEISLINRAAVAKKMSSLTIIFSMHIGYASEFADFQAKWKGILGEGEYDNYNKIGFSLQRMI